MVASMKDRKRGNLLKTVLMLAFVAGAAVFVALQLRKRQLIRRENQGIELANNGHYEEALDVYEGLHSDLKRKEDRDRLLRLMADCYVALAENPALSFKEALLLYRKAYDLDPASVKNAAIVRALSASK